METLFISLADPGTRDQVKTALRSFPALRGIVVPPEHLLSVLMENQTAAALVIDCDATQARSSQLIAQVRELQKDLIILAVGQRSQRERLHRFKLELDIFSYIPLPLDPFDLARRLNRLAEALPSSTPSGTRS